MPKYLTAARLQVAVTRLGSARVNTRFVDFLVTKRALKIANSDQVILSVNDVTLQRAITELMSVYPYDYHANKTIDAPLINVFGTSAHDDEGFRTNKYRSNGTAVTVPHWREVVEIIGKRPRSIRLRPAYLQHLRELLIKGAGELPRLDDTAVWLFRHSSVDSLGGTITELVTTAVSERLGLTLAELTVLFGQPPNASSAETADDLATADEVADPASYLPTASTPTSEISTTATSSDRCSVPLVLAVASRGFAILTGPSGTGKSRGAIHLAQGVEAVLGLAPGSSYAFTAVGADWVDSRPLLGYRNPFGPPRPIATGFTNETYQLTECVRLLLRASDNSVTSPVPHFLILDEMNLSHVERYMSSLLSVIEANRSVTAISRRIPLLDSQTVSLIADVLEFQSPGLQETEVARNLARNNQPLFIPSNLFIVGTVNVDETTYMFSPKVLDRAHVLELEPPDPSAYLAGTIASAEMIQVSAAVNLLRWAADVNNRADLFDKPSDFLKNACEDIGLAPVDGEEILAATSTLLKGAQVLLGPVGFAFGIRVINDVLIYVASWLRAMHHVRNGDPSFFEDWPQALDRAFVQKILPKLHGNRRQLGESLASLGAFLGGGHRDSSPPARYQLGDGPTISIEPQAALDLGAESQMEDSRAKLERMQRQLSSTGYVSFVR